MIALLLAGMTWGAGEANAQVNVNINIGSQPGWGPTGYNHADFYYLPAVNCYYDIGRAMFIYPNGSRWTYARHLPSRYRNVNLYNTYKVVVNQPRPFRYNHTHMRDYGRYRNVHNQPVIRDSRDSRYYVSKGHPMHGKGHQDHRSNGRGRGHANGHRR